MMETTMKKITGTTLLAIAVTLITGCSDNKKYELSMCALVDVSGTYASEIPNAARIVKTGMLPAMSPGDSLFVITIDDNSYTEEDLIAKITLDYTPTASNQQKLAFANTLDEFAKRNIRSSWTDISGAMMLCADQLKHTGSGKKTMIIFSDMQEELQKGLVRKFKEIEFEGIDIAAINILILGADSRNPEIYRNRLADWEQRILKSGAKSWATLTDPLKIPEYIANVKN